VRDGRTVSSVSGGRTRGAFLHARNEHAVGSDHERIPTPRLSNHNPKPPSRNTKPIITT